MGKEMDRRYKELTDEGDACLASLASIDKRVGQAFLHLKEVFMYSSKHDSQSAWNGTLAPFSLDTACWCWPGAEVANIELAYHR